MVFEQGLTPEEIGFYSAQGYVSPTEVLTAKEAAEAYEHFRRYESCLGGCIQHGWRFKAHLLLPWLADIIRHPRVVAVVQSALNTPHILCWSSDIFVKEAKDKKYTGWHQDSTYVAFSDPPDVLTLWLALTPSTPESGCVRFWPRSHLRGQLDHEEGSSPDSLLLKGQEVAVEVPESEGVDACLQPGEASLHHIKLVHGSGPNISDQRRVGIAIRYMAASVKQNLPVRDSVTLVSGEPPGDYYKLEPRPASELDEAAKATHRDAVGPVYPSGTEPPNWDRDAA
uniref:Phytanoyl-dioxygenase n=1 Tax=Tetraselmis sp. GSL018 TaxID=582737 RepID=A0A061SBA9_9CHLO